MKIRALRRILGPRKEEVKGRKRNLHNERFHEPFSSAATVFMCVLRSTIVDGSLCLNKIPTKNSVTREKNYEKPLDLPDRKED